MVLHYYNKLSVLIQGRTDSDSKDFIIIRKNNEICNYMCSHPNVCRNRWGFVQNQMFVGTSSDTRPVAAYASE